MKHYILMGILFAQCICLIGGLCMGLKYEKRHFQGATPEVREIISDIALMQNAIGLSALLLIAFVSVWFA